MFALFDANQKEFLDIYYNMLKKKHREVQFSSRLKLLSVTDYQVMEWIDCSDKIKHSELGLKKDTRSSDHRKKQQL